MVILRYFRVYRVQWVRALPIFLPTNCIKNYFYLIDLSQFIILSEAFHLHPLIPKKRYSFLTQKESFSKAFVIISLTNFYTARLRN